jgi:hypothetical protein
MGAERQQPVCTGIVFKNSISISILLSSDLIAISNNVVQHFPLLLVQTHDRIAQLLVPFTHQRFGKRINKHILNCTN